MKSLAASFLVPIVLVLVAGATPVSTAILTDTDGDGVDDDIDNCPTIANSDQADQDGNGIGDVCAFVPVDDAYFVSSTEVTNWDYVRFLNAVARTDPNALYNVSMATDPRGGILRTGNSGFYNYTVKSNMGNKPANFVAWLDAARYANWLHLGRPFGAQGSSTTESGAYDLLVANPGQNAQRNVGALWFLPSDSEWTRAAHHDPAAERDWVYPTRSDDTPTEATADGNGNISNPGFNVANYGPLAGRPTTVGSAGPLSSSAYGTYDQGGNVREWTESRSGGDRITRGGGFLDDAGPLRSDTPVALTHFTETSSTGFRVAHTSSCPDDDEDGVPDCVDNCPTIANPSQADMDGDYVGDICDNCPTVQNPSQSDCNGDGRGDACAACPCDPGPPDPDGDGRCSSVDNCPEIANPSQADVDGDGVGDVCDNCPTVQNPSQSDCNGDGRGDACAVCPCDPIPDPEGDGVCSSIDNCPAIHNPDQHDVDADGSGNACDNCPAVANAAQTDQDQDGRGDACDDCALDYDPQQGDFDHDGRGDLCDLDDGRILILFADADHIQWQQESGPAWNVYEGDLDVLRATAAYTQDPSSSALADRHCGLTTTSVDDVDRPPFGKTVFSLVTGVQNGVEGTLGEDSTGATRPNSNPCP